MLTARDILVKPSLSTPMCVRVILCWCSVSERCRCWHVQASPLSPYITSLCQREEGAAVALRLKGEEAE